MPVLKSPRSVIRLNSGPVQKSKANFMTRHKYKHFRIPVSSILGIFCHVTPGWLKMRRW